MNDVARSAVLRQVHGMVGMPVHAPDGAVGRVHDIYFDDRDWHVRYFHVDTRPWLIGRHVLLAPTVVRFVDWESDRIDVAITREQVEQSPDVDSHKPVSRQHELAMYEYFAWPFASSSALWEGEELAARLHSLMIEMHAQDMTAPSPPPPENADAHLWSVDAVHHYTVENDNGKLGRVADFMVLPDTWTLRYLVAEKGGPLHANRFLVPVDAVHGISGDTRQVRVSV